jgi:hypothetical protein
VDEMGSHVAYMAEMSKVYLLVGKPEGKILLGRSAHS